MKLFWRQVDYPLLRPLTVGGKVLHERSVIELRLESFRGTSYGEASPLPGLHSETLEELPAMLPQALDRLNRPRNVFDLRVEAVADHDPWRELPPSLRFALEIAVVRLFQRGERPTYLVGLPFSVAPPSCGLVDRDLADLDPGLAAHRCLKVKVGRRAMHTEVAIVHALRRVLGDHAELRLDANRAFSLEDALDFAHEVASARPVWIEEPLRDPSQLPQFTARTGLRVALDESLHEPEHAALAAADGVAAWVLKPALLGLLGTVELFGRALVAPNRPQCVVSSSFEGRLGLETLRFLANCAPGLPAPGLGTGEWLGPADFEPWIEVHADN